MVAPLGGKIWVYRSKVEFCYAFITMRKQMINRLGIADIRNTVSHFTDNSSSSEQACFSLEVRLIRPVFGYCRSSRTHPYR